VLLLSGEADPVTPPANAEHALATLPNGRHIVAPGQGHGILARGCVPKVVEAFLEAGSADGLDARCVDKLAAQPFFTGYTGSEP
jgi:pimeloyl-ACP methyl ester carboxylesterase